MAAIMPGSTKGGGNCLAFPDTCLTPGPGAPVPVPYPNTGMLQQAMKVSLKVKFFAKEVVKLDSEIPQTMGDEAGTNGGVISGVFMNKATFKRGSSKVKIEGKPCVHLTSVTGQNGTNANMPSGVQLSPSQTKVIVAM